MGASTPAVTMKAAWYLGMSELRGADLVLGIPPNDMEDRADSITPNALSTAESKPKYLVQYADAKHRF